MIVPSQQNFRLGALKKKYQKLYNRVKKALENGLYHQYSIQRQQQLLLRLNRYEQRLKRCGIVVVGLSGLLISSPDLQAQTPTTGSEFLVNTYTTLQQQSNSIAMDDEGNFVVVWESLYQIPNSNNIYAQRFDNTGATMGSEFLVNSFTGNSVGASGRNSPSVAMDSDGDFVVVWDSEGQDGGLNSSGIYGQRYDNTGATAGGEFLVNTFTTGSQFQASIAMDSDGDFVVVWQSAEQDGDNFGIYAQRYDNTGATVGGEFRVNTHTTSGQGLASVAMDNDGDFVVAWSGFQNGYPDIYAQRYDNTGATVGGEFLVNTFTTNTQQSPSVAMDNDGDFVIVWEDGDYYNDGQDGKYSGVYAQRYDNTGATVGGEFQVNTFTDGYQERTSVAMDKDGDFVVTWLSSAQSKVYAQQYDNIGATVGGEFLVIPATEYGSSPAVAMECNGDFVVTWENYGKDGDGGGIYGQRYSEPGPLPSVSVALQGAVSLAENSGSTLTFRFSRNNVGIDCPISLFFSMGGAAVKDTDYTINAHPSINTALNKITFPENVNMIDMVITLTDDTIVENNEIVEVTILP